MKKILLISFVFISFSLRADWGGFYNTNRSYIEFKVNGTSNWKTVWSEGPGDVLDWDAGNITPIQTFTINSFNIKTYKNDGSDVTGGTFYYRIYKNNSTGSFNSQSVSWQENIDGNGNQQWGGFENQELDLLSGLTEAGGNYVVEFYSTMNGTAPNETKYDNYSGSNFKVYFSYGYSISWTGNSDSDWNTSNNWNPTDNPPTKLYNVTIPNTTLKPIINQSSSEPAECGNLTIDASGLLTVNDGKAISIKGDLVNNQTAGIVLKSPETSGPTGSLIVEGTVSGSGTITAQRYIAAYTTAENGWHLFSSPFDNFDVTGTNLEPSSTVDEEDDLYYWDEAVGGDFGTWMNWKASSFNLNAGKGYLISSFASEIKTWTGTPYHADKVFSNLSYTNPHPTENNTWHLLGNPFMSAITWNNENGWSLTNIGGGVAKVMDVTDGSYIDVNAGGVIPAFQGFFCIC